MSADTNLRPIPANEVERLEALFDLDLDYTDLQKSFEGMTKLAAKVAGTDISMINLIDLYTQWTVANHGLPIEQMPREDSVCQHTIMQDDAFEVDNLSLDERFKDKFYVTDNPNLRYYFGLPLKTSSGQNIGALCVLDTEKKEISPEKAEMLKIIADEVVNRLKALKAIEQLRNRVHESHEKQKRVAHDIRGPVGGIIGLARIIAEQGNENELEEVLEFISLIQKSGHSILELADEILSADTPKKEVKLGADEFNQLLLKDKLEKLYMPQAVNKKISFTVQTSAETEIIPFSKNKLLQIVGNLISNSMKFTPVGGSINVELQLKVKDTFNELQILVSDTGVGMSEQKRLEILSGKSTSTGGTSGEVGYGFGLALVKHLVEGLKGSLEIRSTPGEGTTFEISLPQGKF